MPPGKTFNGIGTGSSPVIADGRVILLRDLELDDQSQASPTVAGDTLYVRTGKALYAFGDGK